jgi:hypothetical protein
MEVSFKCTCQGHELHVELPEAFDRNRIDLTIWSKGNEVGSGWVFRLKLIWQVLTIGHGFKDMVTLAPAEAREMAKILFHFADVAEKREAAKTS